MLVWLSFAIKDDFPFGDIAGLYMWVRMWRLRLLPGAIAEVQDYRHEASGMDEITLKAISDLFGLSF